MPVYQATKNLKFNQGYIKHSFYKGQPVRTEDKTFLNFLSGHKYFTKVTNPKIIQMAPPIHLIKKVKRPTDMQKEEIIAELKQSGVNENPYQIHDHLAIKLQTVRRMRPRNWITVLNERGVPVFIDTIKLDEKQPEEQIPEHTMTKFTPQEQKVVKPQNPDTNENSDIKLIDSHNAEGNAASVQKTTNTDLEDDGSYDRFLNEYANKPSNPVVEPIKEVNAVDIVLEEAEEAEKEITEQDKEIELNEKILNIDNWRYLIATNREGMFYENQLDSEELEKLKVVKKTKINIIVYATFLTKHGIWEIEPDEHNNRRWNTMKTIGEMLDGMSDEDRTIASVEINLLQRRFNDLEKLEPNYKKSSTKQLRRKLTMLSKFGLNIAFDEDTDIRRYTKTAFLIAKRGLQIPATLDEMDALLDKYKNL